MPVLQVHSLTAKENNQVIVNDVSFTLEEGEHLAVVGPSGSGKTTLLRSLAGVHSYTGRVLLNYIERVRGGRIIFVEQQHRFKNLSNTNTFYYQQRFNSCDADDTVTVREYLETIVERVDNETGIYGAEVTEVMHLLKVQELLPVKLIQLSNGENKRLQIARALLLKPAILLLDNPFVGLDTEARKTLDGLLHDISEKGIPIILITAPYQLPSFITHVLNMGREGNISKESVAEFFKKPSLAGESLLFPDVELLKELTGLSSDTSFEFAVRMRAVRITYNDRKILDNIHWEVRNGERWGLSGPNGAGKSTLLSLINADNPQAYANEIYLFDRRRGTGESIWDIKKKIGFISPELHLYFDTSINCFDVVSSGLFDTIGLFRFLNEVQLQLVAKWMKLLRIERLANKMPFQLSNSEQRLVLLARALVKNPPLLLLDEPCQGLDDQQVNMFKTMINEICMQTGKTLIYVSHYPHEIPNCVDRFLRLQEGEVQS